MKALKEHVSLNKLDVIAITNHDCFDLQQFREIEKEIKECVVFPGIEISLKGGHLLIISKNENIEDFSNKCKEISESIKNDTTQITPDNFNKVFTELDNYIVIPHKEKSNSIADPEKLFGKNITAFEASSVKKFNKIKRDDTHNINPVIFSDFRATDKPKHILGKLTYFEGVKPIKDFKGLRKAFSTSETYHSELKNTDLLQIPKSKAVIFKGVNLLLGKRASGKTFLLNEINDRHKEDSINSVKYIEQFTISSEAKEFDRKKTGSFISKYNLSFVSRQSKMP